MKKLQKSFVIPIIIVIMALLVVGGGYLYYKVGTLGIFQPDLLSENSRIIDECQLKDKERCLSEKAIAAKDKNLCKLIPEASNFCYGEFGRTFSDLSACNLIIPVGTNTSGSATGDVCYISIALEKNDPKICEKLIFGDYINRCYGQIAFNTKDKSLCDKTGGYKIYCISNIDSGIYRELRN